MRVRLILSRWISSVGGVGFLAGLVRLEITSIMIDGMSSIDVAIDGITGICVEDGSYTELVSEYKC